MITRLSRPVSSHSDRGPHTFLVADDVGIQTVARTQGCAASEFQVERVPARSRLFSGHLRRGGTDMDLELKTLLEIDRLDPRAADVLWYADRFERHTTDEDTHIACVGIAADLTFGVR